MYRSLGRIELKDGEKVEAGVVQGPDLEWAERIEELLSHKGEIWNWQNSELLRSETGVDARFYVLHRNGDPFAHMMTATFRGTGHFGHVWTRPADRRKGAASQLMGLVMEDFCCCDGMALFLGTGFDSPPYRIYASHGFRGIEEKSGYMEYYVDSKKEFEAWYFAPAETSIREADWPHWPASAALFLGDFPGVVRALPLGLLGRSSTEHAFLHLVREEKERGETGEESRAKLLVQGDSGAVVGLAVWRWDPLWPETCLVDLYCHPDFWGEGDELLESLPLPEAERYAAYSDEQCPEKGEVLKRAGFQEAARRRQWVAADRARRNLVDVIEWERS